VESLRINRYLARCGLGSRRAVEALVLEGRVRINDDPEHDLSRRIFPDQDVVTVDGEVVQLPDVGRVLLLHKPIGVVSSLVRQDQRPCLLDILPEEWRRTRLFHVGRLDQDSSGLLLLSDDGDLAQALLHPSKPVYKVYRLRVRPALGAAQLEKLADGSIVLDGRAASPARVRRLGEAADRALLEIELREGRNRQLRRMIEAVGGRVLSLERVAFGPVELGELPVGQVREASTEEYRLLHELMPSQR
jgi:pseudouridine synthase